MQFKTSIIQPLETPFVVLRKVVLFHFSVTSFFDRTFEFLIKKILPLSGTFCKSILYPIQPALFAFSLNGFLCSIISDVKKCFGIIKKLFTFQLILSYVRKKSLDLILN